MAASCDAARAELSSLFGQWISFDRIERKLYSHDIGVLPRVIQPLTGFGTAGAVVQPGSEEEIVRLMDIARRYALTVTPRGAATSANSPLAHRGRGGRSRREARSRPRGDRKQD